MPFQKGNQLGKGNQYRKGLVPWNKGIKTNPLSEEHKRKIGLSGIGQNNPMSRTNINKRKLLKKQQ